MELSYDFSNYLQFINLISALMVVHTPYSLHSTPWYTCIWTIKCVDKLQVPWFGNVWLEWITLMHSKLSLWNVNNHLRYFCQCTSHRLVERNMSLMNTCQWMRTVLGRRKEASLRVSSMWFSTTFPQLLSIECL